MQLIKSSTTLPNIIIVDKYKLRIMAIQSEALGKISQKTIDLTAYAGQHVRLWLDLDGGYSMDPKKDHYWQIAELDVPEIQYQQVDSGETDNDGNSIMISEVLPLDLTDTKIAKWELPV
jgi:hypothetical protein